MLANYTLVRLGGGLHAIFNFTVALSWSFDYDIRAAGHIQRASEKYRLPDFKFVVC